MFKKLFWISALIALGSLAWYLLDLPDTSQLRLVNPQTSSIRTYREKQVRDKGGTPHSQMRWRSLAQISPHLVHAVVLSEDDTFFQHNGFDVNQLKRAVQTNWERKRFAFGASTITQQLARTLYLSSRKNLLRKVKEALITRRLEETLPKKRILEIYLNVVEWGPEIYGAEAASQYFFGKPALELSPEEAIALAAVLPSPRRWNPLRDTKFMAQRKISLYERMVMAHYIPPVISSEPVATPLPLTEQLLPAAPGSSPDEMSEEEVEREGAVKE